MFFVRQWQQRNCLLCSLTVSLSLKPTITHLCRPNPMLNGCHLFQKLISRVHYYFHRMAFVTKSIFEPTFMSSFVSGKCITFSRKQFHRLFKQVWEIEFLLATSFFNIVHIRNFMPKQTSGLKQNFQPIFITSLEFYLHTGLWVMCIQYWGVHSPSLNMFKISTLNFKCL